MGRQNRWVPILMLLGALLVACEGTDVPEGIGLGNHAPDFTLTSLYGQDVSLAEYRGSVVLLNFWATWCEPCRQEIPALEAAYRARQADGFVVLGVNFQESPEEVKAFVDAFDVSYRILLDTNGQVMKKFRAVGLPFSLIVDGEGIIQVRHTGLLDGTQLENYLATVLP